jgi:phosphohistidine phosphatase SixA
MIKKYSFAIAIAINLFYFTVIIFVLLSSNRLTRSTLVSNYDRIFLTQNKIDLDIDFLWAEEVLHGGYILHVRHPHRIESKDIHGFDLYEFVNSENLHSDEYISKFTCLSDEGFATSNLLKWVILHYNIPIENVYSSPSCRAREAAKILTDGDYLIENSLLYIAAIPNSQRQQHVIDLEIFLLDLKKTERSNIILVGHEGIPFPWFSKKVDETFSMNLYVDIDSVRSQGGVSVMSIDSSGRLIIHHHFKSTTSFLKAIDSAQFNSR